SRSPSDRPSSQRQGLASCGADHFLPRSPELIDAQLDDVAKAKIDGLRLHAERYACWSAGADHVPWQQRHELTHVADEKRDAEDHVGRGRTLASVAIHGEPHAERLRVGDLIARGEKRPDR